MKEFFLKELKIEAQGKMMRHKFAVLMGWIVGLSIFGGWMSIVGNPHVVETSIGIVIALISGFLIFFKIEPNADL